MNAEQDLDRDGHLVRPSGTSIAIIAVGVVLFGYTVATVARHPVASNAASAPSEVTNVVTAGSAAVESPVTAAGAQKPLPTLGNAPGGPRECEPAKGITTDCIFE